MKKKLLAEGLGTFWLVFGGVGSVVLWGGTASMVNVALAFGLTVVTMAYAIGHISGCHLNPAVTLGLTVAGKFPAREAGPYMLAQGVGGIAAAAVLYLIVADMTAGAVGSLGANAIPAGGVLAAFLTEAILTMFFLVVILGATSKAATPAMAGLVIGLCLALIHMIGIGVTGVSVNPARSLGPALFSGTDALADLWLFIVAPGIGAVAGAFVYGLLEGERPEPFAHRSRAGREDAHGIRIEIH
ncbi:MAG TPA: aquaporin [Kofleriaceae bacterium]|nr:aquaporin [Kofleriaceae bacterium]